MHAQRRDGRQRGPAPPRQTYPQFQRPQLFEDTSNVMYPGQGYGQSSYLPGPDGGVYATASSNAYHNDPGIAPYLGQQYLSDPVANVAMQYGQSLAGQGQQMVKENLEKYVATSRLKYYFAVDTAYVGKKLGLVIFPFLHSDWSIRYREDEPIAPRYEINAPDLYIPVMSFVTYILVAGVVLGTQSRFTPEQLGITSSQALMWLIIEILILLLMTYLMQVSTGLRYLDIVAYCGYKYVSIILCLIAGLLFQSTGYYVTLLWTSISLAFFLSRSLKMGIVPRQSEEGYGGRSGGGGMGTKRHLYMLLFIACTQPFFIWWLTSHLLFNGNLMPTIVTNSI